MPAFAPTDMQDVWKRAMDEVKSQALNPRSLTIKTCGTKFLDLDTPVSPETGYWQDPTIGNSKPKRWIFRVTQGAGGTPDVSHAGDVIGYFNPSRTSSVLVRLLLAVKPDGADLWEFPPGWEAVVLITVDRPLEGTSSETLRDYDASAKTIKRATETYGVLHAAVVRGPDPTALITGISYDDAVAAIAEQLGARRYDGRIEQDLVALGADVDAALAQLVQPGPSGVFSLEPLTTLFGVDPTLYLEIQAAVNSGKRHIIFYGPPGTGKTTMAEYVASELAQWERDDEQYVMLTASSAWTAQDLVGGYQPTGEGQIGFIPGALLRNFDRPVVVDELNRCPVDKVLGPLFSVLSGQTSVLPYRVNVADPTSEFFQVLPKAPAPPAPEHEYGPGPAWHLLCTLNTYDKTQLGQISYALSRRFAWIEVPAPSDLAGYVRDYLASHEFTPSEDAVSPVAAMWEAVNDVRPVGAAPINDFMSVAKQLAPGIDLLAAPDSSSWSAYLGAFRMCVLPLMDGLPRRDTDRLAASLSEKWKLDPARTARLKASCVDFSA